MPASIFSGTKVKLLKDHLIGFSDKDLIISGTANPTSAATTATPGTLYLNSSTGQVFRKQDSGSSTNWTDISEAIGDDYILSQQDFENNINSASTPSTGLSVAANTTTELDGDQSLRCSKDAADRSTGYFILDSFTNKKGLFATVIRVQALVSTSANYADDDCSFVLYDVTNSTKIPFLPEGLLAGDGIYQGSAQTSADGLSYQIRLYVDSTNATAYDIDIDNLKTYVAAIPSGTVVTEWKSFTPTGSWTGTAVYSGVYRRVGDQLEVSCKVLCSGGAPTGTSLLFDLPSGLTIDTTKFSVANPGIKPIGTMGIFDSGASYPVGYVTYQTSTTVGARYFNENADYITYDTVTPTAPITFAANDYVEIRYSVPIVGWGAQSILGEDAGTREVVEVYSDSSAQAAITSPLAFATKVKSTHGAWSGTLFTAPQSGTCVVMACITTASTAETVGDGGHLLVYDVTASAVVHRGVDDRAENTAARPFSWNVQTAFEAIKGHQYRVNGSLAGIASSLVADASYNRVAWYMPGSPQQIAAGEKVIGHYNNLTAATPASAAREILKYSSKQVDTHNCYNSSTGQLTVPKTGYLTADMVMIYAASSNWVDGDSSEIRLYDSVGGLIYRQYTDIAGSATSKAIALKFNVKSYPVTKGDILTFEAVQNSGAALAFTSSASYCWFGFEIV